MTREEEIEAAWEQLLTPVVARTALRNRLAGEQGWRCCYRGCKMCPEQGHGNSATFEHVIPRSLGGSDDVSNIAIACYRCNNDRRSRMLPIHLEMECRA